MDINKFQEKLAEICKLGEENGKALKPEQIKECFGDMDLDKSQLIKILQYLKLQGISIEGAEALQKPADPETPGTEETQKKVPLTAEEEEYLREYLENLEEQKKVLRSTEELFGLLNQGDALAAAELSQKYLPRAAQMAAELNCEEKWLLGRIRAGILRAIEEQTQKKFEDDYLVAKVEKLEAAVRELTEDDEDEKSKFSVEELAIILDMDVEEIRDVLRLTGDDK